MKSICLSFLLCSLFALSTLSFCHAAGKPTPVPQLPVLNWEPRSDWISVKDHGAVGDGKTDDTAAIQKALDKIYNWGTAIYFPPGTYRVTDTLFIKNRRYIKHPHNQALFGILLVGHGRDTRIVWDGKAGRVMLETGGTGYSRIVGLDFDGKNKSSIGYYQFNIYTFPTVLRFQHCAYRNFTMAGIYAEPTLDKLAFPETSFENCMFEKCAVGVSFTQFNDYDIIFDGCEFRYCGTGIECIHGNYYVRNTHFEGSLRADIISYPEHGCSVRRTTSLNSNMFLLHSNSVTTFTIENCAISGWKNLNGAVSVSGAPGMIFDCHFSDPPPGAKRAVNVSHRFRLVSSQNTTPEGLPLYVDEKRLKQILTRVYEIPAGKRQGIPFSPRQQFLKSEVKIPGKVFDAKRDFGANGKMRADDTEAIQKTIDAAREHGNGAIAYIPPGRYIIKKTLHLTGKDYYFGGAGMRATIFHWQGDKDRVTIEVENPENITIENLDLQKKSGIDILQKSSTDKKTFVSYDGLFVSRPNDPPYPGGIQLQGLSENDTVLIPCLVGAMKFIDCSRARILVPISYYGSIIVEGKDKQRDGFIGIMARFSGGTRNVIIRDNHSIVMSDYYSENSGNIFFFEGTEGDPPGRITVQGAKLHLNSKKATSVIEVNNYEGQIFIGHDQFNGADAGKIILKGDRPLDLFIFATCFYKPGLDAVKHPSAAIYLLGIKAAGKSAQFKDQLKDSLPPAKLPEIANALDDLRRLGKIDLELNFPNVPVAPEPPKK